MRTCIECSKDHKDMKRKLCGSCRVRRARSKMKRKAIEYMGGKCQCGYSKCDKALHFHHLDPNEKDFQISASNNRSWNVIVKELDKCVLLCANCHAEEHDKNKSGSSRCGH